MSDTEGGVGVWKMLTLADKGGRGIQQILIFAEKVGRGLWQFWTALTKMLYKGQPYRFFIKLILYNCFVTLPCDAPESNRSYKGHHISEKWYANVEVK